jgi:hypothetical protein
VLLKPATSPAAVPRKLTASKQQVGGSRTLYPNPHPTAFAPNLHHVTSATSLRPRLPEFAGRADRAQLFALETRGACQRIGGIAPRTQRYRGQLSSQHGRGCDRRHLSSIRESDHFTGPRSEKKPFVCKNAKKTKAPNINNPISVLL